MKPSKKSPELEEAFNTIFGIDRKGSIEHNTCVAPPIGCGQVIENPEKHFRSQISLDEYRISGLCQKCQDEVFG